MKLFVKMITFILFVTALVACQEAPNKESKNNIKIGIQTWSFRTMEDQTPLAILSYIKESGIKYVELMGNHAESFAGAPESLMYLEKRVWTMPYFTACVLQKHLEHLMLL